VALASAVLAAVTLAMFGDVLFGGGQTVLSSKDTDIALQHIYWCEFGFGEMGRGNLALWNPHVFCGAPFLGSLLPALLYPPNLIFLALPVGAAVNLGIALHVFLLGLFMYLWASYRGLHTAAALLTAVLAMFCGPYFLHIYAGHMGLLFTAAWAPLLLLAVERIIDTRRPGWCLVGALAVAMQILAGHVQTAFLTGVAAVVFAAANIIVGRRRGRAVLLFGCLYAGGVMLAAAQLLPAVEAARESTRAAGLSYETASSLSFAPENFVTLLAPNFFGDRTAAHPYWGRWYVWEMSVFFGATGLFLAVYGAFAAPKAKRRFSALVALVLLLLALGGYTPLFKLLYNFVPPFDKFRGVAKFVIPASLFLSLLAGVGLDDLIRRGRAGVRAAVIAFAACGVVAAAAVFVYASASTGGWWGAVMQAMKSHAAAVGGLSEMPAERYDDAEFVRSAGRYAAAGLAVAAATLACAGGLLLASRTKLAARAIYALGLLAAAEVFVFACMWRDTFPISLTRDAVVREFLARRPGDYRILNTVSPNSAVGMGARDVGGYQPGAARMRYAEFMAFTQGLDPGGADDYIRFGKVHPLHAMLGLRYVFFEKDGTGYHKTDRRLPRAWPVSDCRVIRGRDAIFAAMGEDFDPAGTVILETEPAPAPVQAPEAGALRIIESSSDELTIEADLPAPAILVVSEVYASGWRIEPLEAGPQQQYRIMPANYVLRAVPLAAGHHRFRMFYRPLGFVIGKWVSIASAVGYLALLLWWYRRRVRRKASASQRRPI